MRFTQAVTGWKQKFLGSLPFLERTSVPHFVRDYRRLVSALVLAHGHKRAMEMGVGDEFSAVGKLELALLLHLGLKPGQMIVDIGCGSGRLGAALVDFPDIIYHGIDVVPEFLDHAKKQSPAHFRYTLVKGLSIPEPDNVADFVTLFSVITHL